MDTIIRRQLGLPMEQPLRLVVDTLEKAVVVMDLALTITPTPEARLAMDFWTFARTCLPSYFWLGYRYYTKEELAGDDEIWPILVESAPTMQQAGCLYEVIGHLSLVCPHPRECIFDSLCLLLMVNPYVGQLFYQRYWETILSLDQEEYEYCGGQGANPTLMELLLAIGFPSEKFISVFFWQLFLATRTEMEWWASKRLPASEVAPPWLSELPPDATPLGHFLESNPHQEDTILSFADHYGLLDPTRKHWLIVQV